MNDKNRILLRLRGLSRASGVAAEARLKSETISTLIRMTAVGATIVYESGGQILYLSTLDTCAPRCRDPRPLC
jgi:hypothetical protein